MIFSVIIHAISKIILKLTMGSFEKVRLAHCEICMEELVVEFPEVDDVA